MTLAGCSSPAGKEKVFVMSYLRSKVVAQAQSWIGCKESDGSHKAIIDVYNSHTPLARGYKVQYTDAWCATFVSAVAIKCGYTDIMPTECGCDKMIELYKKLDCWKEDDSYVPDAGDVIFYDWQDSGSGDNTGSSDHVGIVEKVSGTTITVIEGNKSDAVGRRTLQVNGKYIRGYGLPKYTDSSSSGSSGTATGSGSTTTASSSATTEKKAIDAAKSFLKSLAGTYKVNAASGLNMRNGAGTGKKVMVALPNGTKVQNYGYYTSYDGVKWLYCVATYGGVKYTGFLCSTYLKKQ